MNGWQTAWFDVELEADSGIDDVAHRAWAELCRIDTEQGSRRDLLQYALSVYSDSPLEGWSPYSYTRFRQNALMANGKYERIALNVSRNLCDAVINKIASSKPRPMFLPIGADWSLRQSCDKLTQFFDGVADRVKLHEEAVLACTDGVVCGTGVLHAYLESGEPFVERVFPGELYVDPVDALYGAPQCLYRGKSVPKRTLAALFPEAADVIFQGTNVPAPIDLTTPDANQSKDFIYAIEAWKLPSTPDAGDGRYALIIAGKTLKYEKYEHPDFPFVFMRWQRPQLGFWGIGLIEQVASLQTEVNRLMNEIRNAQVLAGTFRVFVADGSNIKLQALDNHPGRIVQYTGQPPIFSTSVAVPPELYQQLDRLVGRMYEISGVSQLAAQSIKPAGLNSGRALRVYEDIQSERFQVFGREYERAHVDIAKRLVEACESAKTVTVLYKAKTHVEEIDFADIDLKSNQFVVQVFPTSSLPTTPAAKLAALEEFFNAGLISKEDFMRNADLPDLKSEIGLQTAPRDLIDERLEKMLSTGEYYPPEPFYNLQLNLQVTTLQYQRSQLDGVPEDRLELLRRYMVDCQAMLQPPAPPEMLPPQAMPEGMPPPPIEEIPPQ